MVFKAQSFESSTKITGSRFPVPKSVINHPTDTGEDFEKLEAARWGPTLPHGLRTQRTVPPSPSAAETLSGRAFLVPVLEAGHQLRGIRVYLKGTLLFDAEFPGLQCVEYTQSLHDEARQALNEHVKSIYRRDQTRFINLIIAVSMLRSISAGIIVELFLRPIGDINIDCMLMEMLCTNNKTQATVKSKCTVNTGIPDTSCTVQWTI
ncbi:nuclear receptor subfamily 0 group B member 1 [Callorhinchus milii]|uniref:nuclear receptor subfamily 0 group B member 1 n=1 Tax=Callorhinchus milii TaxID=7868 RepID=UPI001C3FF407|nr:nuclear receptor subfamily 0 group B member 1 [Callorhinchus milii]